MSYKCQICAYVHKKWPGLRMHMLNRHKDDYPDGFPTKDECFIEDEEDSITPGGEETAFEDEQAQHLYSLLLLHGIKEGKAKLIAQLFSEVETYQNPQSLSSLLNAHLRGPGQAAIPVVVNELYPQRGYMPLYQTQPSSYPYFSGYGSPPSYSPMPDTKVYERIDKIEKMIEGKGNQHNPELEAKQAELEALKAQLDDERAKRNEDRERRRDEQVNQLLQQIQQQNEKMPSLITEAYERANREHELRETARLEGLEEGRKTRATDFEGRVLDIVQDQIAPGALGEIRAGREMLQGLTKKVGAPGTSSGESESTPISEEGASKLAEVMNIEEQMKELAGQHEERKLRK